MSEVRKSVLYSCPLFLLGLNKHGTFGHNYKIAGIKFYENFFSHSGIIAWKT